MKWAPFNAVINDKEVIRKLDLENKKIKKPILSDEQLENLEKLILESYTDESLIDLYYYKNECENCITGIISKIDPVNKKIIINKTTNIYFSNIIKIFKKNT